MTNRRGFGAWSQMAARVAMVAVPVLLLAGPAGAQGGPGAGSGQTGPGMMGPGMGQGMMGQGMMGQGMMGQGGAGQGGPGGWAHPHHPMMGHPMMMGMMCHGMMGHPMMGQPMMGQHWGHHPQGGMGPMGGGGPGGQRGMRGGGMRLVDVNGDGTVSADEAASVAEAMFDRMDADGDERISREEFLDMPDRPVMAERMQAMQGRREARFKAMDRNGDGFVDHDEWVAFHRDRYQAADQDRDGKVSPWEFRSAMRRP